MVRIEARPCACGAYQRCHACRRCRDQIEHVVEPRRRPTEAAMARREIADHAVERVGRLIDEQARQPENQRPEHRGDDAVAEILGQRFDAGARNAMLIETRRVAPDDVTYFFAAGIESPLGQCDGDGVDAVEETALCHQHGNDDELDQPPEARRAAHAIQEIAGERTGDDEDRHGEDAARASCRLAAIIAIEPVVEPGDRPSNELHRMRHMIEERLHVADKGVKQQRREEDQERVEREPVLRISKQHDAAASVRHVTVVNKLARLGAAAKERVWARRQ
jgi:hypothetical protein